VSGEGFILAAARIGGVDELVKFSTEGKVLQTANLSWPCDNAAYDPTNRLFYCSGVDDDGVFVCSFHADTLTPATPRVKVAGNADVTDIQFDRVTNTLLALTSNRFGFIVGSMNVKTGAVTTVVQLPLTLKHPADYMEAYDDVNGVYYIAAYYDSSATGWLPVFPRTRHVGTLIPVADLTDMEENPVWNGDLHSLCGIWTDSATIACTNVSSVETKVFPSLNFSAYGKAMDGSSTFDASTQTYFNVFQAPGGKTSWVKANLKAQTSFVVGINNYIIESMVFIPATEPEQS
jgi:hypothetical protein